jgi:hypothetical protein
LIRDKEHSQHDFAKAFDYPHTFRARSDDIYDQNDMASRSLRGGYSGAFVDDCHFCKSRKFNTLALTNRLVRQRLE